MYVHDPLEEHMGRHHQNFPHNNTLCLGVVRHKSFEIDIVDTILQHNNIWIFSENGQGLGILLLHITTWYCENLAMFVVVYVTRHCSPILQALYMVKYDLQTVHVFSTLHAFHQIDFSSTKIH